MKCRFPSNAPSTGYRRGCRCDRCKATNEAWNEEKKRRYAGVCGTCGGRTYSGSKGTASTLCLSCREWPDEAIIAAMRDWASAHGGIPPTISQWRHADDSHPSSSVVTNRRRERGWNDLLLLAGFGLKCDRRPETQAEIEGLVAAGWTYAAVGERYGVSPQAIRQRLAWRGLTAAKLRAAA